MRCDDAWMCIVFSGISWRTTFFVIHYWGLCAAKLISAFPYFSILQWSCPWKANYARVSDDTKHGTRIGVAYNYSSCLALSHPLVATQWVTMMMLDPAWLRRGMLVCRKGLIYSTRMEIELGTMVIVLRSVPCYHTWSTHSRLHESYLCCRCTP